MGRKKQHKADGNASIKKNDNFGSIYDTMCRHPAYHALSSGAKNMYTLCRVQARSEHGRRTLYKHNEQYGLNYSCEECFVFPAKHMRLYGIDGGNGYKWLQQLEEHGFIKAVERNKTRREVNVYRFCTDWMILKQ